MDQRNPFYVWGEKAENLVGFKDELKFISSFLSNIESGRPSILLINGPPGSGKSLFLERLSLDATSRAFNVVFTQFHSASDTFELDSLKSSKKPLLVTIDDFDFSKKADYLLRQIASNQIPSVGFVVSSISPLNAPSAKSFSLEPFSSVEAHELILRSLKPTSIKMGEECITTLLDESGGNPKIFKLLCWFLFEKLKPSEKIITKGHYLAYSSAVLAFLSREFFGKLFATVSKKESLVLKCFSSSDVLSVNEISNSSKIPLGQVTSMVLRLQKKGLLIKVERGKYRIFARIFAKYVSSNSKP